MAAKTKTRHGPPSRESSLPRSYLRDLKNPSIFAPLITVLFHDGAFSLLFFFNESVILRAILRASGDKEKWGKTREIVEEKNASETSQENSFLGSGVAIIPAV